MKNFKRLLLIFFLTTNIVVNGQDFSINIGESTTNRLTKDKSAQILANFPNSDTIDDSWLINGYLEIKLDNIANSGYNLGVVSEIHKNNLITKEQDVRQIGVTLEKDFNIFKKVIDSDGNYDKASHSRFITSASFKHSNNVIKDDKSLIANIGTSYSIEDAGKNWRFLQTNTRLINIEEDFFAYFFTIMHDHNFGLSYLGGDDEVLLGDVSFNLKIFLLSRLMYKINQPDFFQIQYNFNARTEIFGDTEKDLNALHSLSAGINYKINEKSSIGISYGYQEGANPYTALDNQKFETVSAKLRLVIQ